MDIRIREGRRDRREEGRKNRRDKRGGKDRGKGKMGSEMVD